MNNEYIYNECQITFTPLDTVIQEAQKKRNKKAKHSFLLFLFAVCFALIGTFTIITFLRYGIHQKEPIDIEFLLQSFTIMITLALVYIIQTVVFFWPFALMFYVIRKQFDRQSLANLLRYCLQSKAPLPAVLRTCAITHSWRTQRNLKNLVRMLESGYTLQDSVNHYPGLFSENTVQFIMLHGDSPEVLNLIKNCNEGENINSNIYTTSTARFIYLIICFGIILQNMTVLIVYIFPKFNEIFADFDTELPTISKILFSLSEETIPQMVTVPLALFSMFIFFLIYIVLVRLAIVPWRPWFMRWMFCYRDSAQILRFLGGAIHLGDSIPEAMNIYCKTLRSHYRYQKATRIKNLIEQGTPWIDVLKQFNIVTKKEAIILDSSQRAGNSDSVLYDLALAKEAKQNRNADLNSKIIFTLLIFTFGLFVLFFAVACMLPIFRLAYELGN